ncbi:MAG: glycosyl transferase [Bacteroidetes bacterium]|nr:MAG: glycosyl transferase [Bacteroidota bacterium]
MTISIIIPTYNEAAHIERLLTYLQQHTQAEILVANSPNTRDQTAAKAAAMGVRVLNCPVAGRAQQMNYGAAQTQSEVIYFVHADTLPPASFLQDIAQSLEQGYDLGYFSYCFDSNSWLLRINGYCTRFDGLFAGGGDQTLFIKRNTFEQLGGFREELYIMEDFDLVKRAKKAGFKQHLITNDALVSARKYEKNSWLWVNIVNLSVFALFHLGVSQERLFATYRQLLRMD